MSHGAKTVVDRSQGKTSSGKPGVTSSSRAQKQPSEMLQRWKAESRQDMTFNERIYGAAQEHAKAKGKQ
ncbi:hypothetical protein N0V93_007351 [Gnomoniopsis smithogilvyi]|uniref:Uncharacterized protein n=1 Tax=Gnomoniopsis smithogilvyi TaxID=1191159 RepID=A0A9W8YR67_9PEZI|nr:hypothetical protein N0V93_007351 [Gnomoniopsis smithogilvyi]